MDVEVEESAMSCGGGIGGERVSRTGRRERRRTVMDIHSREGGWSRLAGKSLETEATTKGER